MVEGEDPVEYLSRIDKTVQKLAMLGETKDDDVNVHIVQSLSASYEVEKKILLSSPDLTRSNIEEIVRNAYMSHKQNAGKGNGQTKGDNPHVLYAGGAQPAGAGGNGMGRHSKGKQKSRQKQQKQQQQQPQPPHQQQQRQHQSGDSGVVGPMYRLGLVYGQWRWDDSRSCKITQPSSGYFVAHAVSLNPPPHHTTEIGRPEPTMSPMELVATLLLAMLRSTLPQYHTPPRPSTPRMTLKGQRNPRKAVARRLLTPTFSPRRLPLRKE